MDFYVKVEKYQQEQSALGGIHELGMDGGLPSDFRMVLCSNYKNLPFYPL